MSSDGEILARISVDLKDRPKINGVIYCHNIQDNRLNRIAYQAIKIFKELCGDKAMENVILCTTHWDSSPDKTRFLQREEKLRSDFWRDMVGWGARMSRHDNTLRSAETIVELILKKEALKLRLMDELVDSHLPLNHTSAGKVAFENNREREGNVARDLRNLGPEDLMTEDAKDERDRLLVELQKLRDEKALLETPVDDVVEYCKRAGEKICGRRFGRFIGGFWGHIGKALDEGGDRAADLFGGRTVSDKNYMQRAADAAVKGNDHFGMIGSGVMFSAALAQSMAAGAFRSVTK